MRNECTAIAVAKENEIPMKAKGYLPIKATIRVLCFIMGFCILRGFYTSLVDLRTASVNYTPALQSVRIGIQIGGIALMISCVETYLESRHLYRFINKENIMFFIMGLAIFIVPIMLK